MQREQQERQDIMGALDRERQAAVESKRAAEKQHLAALQAERDHQSALSEKLMQTQVPMLASFKSHLKHLHRLQQPSRLVFVNDSA